MPEPVDAEIVGPERAPIGVPTTTPIKGLTTVSPDAPMVSHDGSVDMGLGASSAALEAIYPQSRDEGLRNTAHTAFIKGEKLVAIAKKLGVDINVISYWASAGGWIKARAMLLAALEGEENLSLTAMRIERRRDLLERHLNTSARIRDRVDGTLEADHALTPSEIKNLAEASASAATADGRALGLCENGAVSEALGNGGKDGGNSKVPLVLVFQGGLPEVQVRR